MKKFTYTLVFIILVPLFSLAQPSLSIMRSGIESKGNYSSSGVLFKLITPTQAGIFFSGDYNLSAANTKSWIENLLQLRPGIDELRADNNNVANTPDGFSISKLHQYFRNIKVEHGTVSVTTKSQKAAMVQLEFYPVADNFNLQPAISGQLALAKAIEYAKAAVYQWASADSALLSENAPHPELVILKDYELGDTICLAYKFDITTLQPFSSAFIYINAMDGRIILNDPQARHADRGHTNILKDDDKESLYPNKAKLNNKDILLNAGANEPVAGYSNSQGTAATRYSGSQVIFTDNHNPTAGKPFRLRATRNGQDIETYNFLGQPHNAVPDQYQFAIDFEDNDNNWSAAEFNNAAWDNAALDVQFAMQIVSDYWLFVHGRNGWNNGNGPIKSYVHAYEFRTVNGSLGNYFLANAFWWKGKMTFGDGRNTQQSPPWTSFDICAHEMGHAITETTCNLIYQWESGAMNEAFSDIWAACITKYALDNYTLQNENIWRVGEKADNVGTANPGIRDMANPPLYSDPSAYKNSFWKPASLTTCRNFDTTDNCGVHSNSGVLNKWFYLITQGQQGTNSFGTPFDVTGLGFTKSEKIVYLTELNLTPNASYQTCRTVSLFATANLYGTASEEYASVWNAWVAVAVDSNIYNMANTPIFGTNNFTSIAVGKSGVVMAGTNYNGVYKFFNDTWEKMPDMTDVRFNDIKTDYLGNFWIAQSGRSGQQSGGSSIAGGVNYYVSPFTGPATLYTIGNQTDVPSRNARCIYVDTFRNRLPTENPIVWMASTSYITSSNSTSGMLGKGLNPFTPAFTNVSEGINIASGTAGCLTIGGNKDVIWTFSQANNGINQLLTYNAATNALIETFDHNTHPTIPSGFVARSIYCDVKKRTWIGLAAGGIIVFDENRTWHYISPTNFPEIFPAGSQASFNAITGTKDGDIYIGTTTGIVFFERGDGAIGRIDDAGSYRSFGKPNGLPSNVINAIAFDTLRYKLLVATDSGVVFWEPLCIGVFCKQYKFSADKQSETTGPGNWSNPAIWSTGVIPDSSTVVIIKHNVMVDIDGKCNYLSTEIPGANLTVQAGKKLTIYSKDEDIIYTGSGDRGRRRR